MLPAELQKSNKPELNPQESARFAETLLAWHEERQRESWREVSDGGPRVLVAHRAMMLYFWAALLVIMFVPPSVPRGILAPVPRFVVVLLPIAAVAALLAVPLGLGDWRRARRKAGINP